MAVSVGCVSLHVTLFAKTRAVISNALAMFPNVLTTFDNAMVEQRFANFRSFSLSRNKK